MSTSPPDPDQESDHSNLHSTSINNNKPSGLSHLFKKSEEVRPLNAFIVTSKVPPIYYTNSDYDATSSLKSSSYYTASLGQEPDTTSINSEDSESLSQPLSPLSQYPNYLSRTISSANYFDNQSDYEVILDDGSKQKRTISLSTVQLVPSRHNAPKTSTGNFSSFLDKWMFNKSNKDFSNKIDNENTALLVKNDKITHDMKDDHYNTHSSSSSSSSSDASDGNSSDSHYGKQDLLSRRKQRTKRKSHSRLKYYRKQWTSFQIQYLTLSHKQKMVLKCTFAYIIGCLFTFVPRLNALCGTHIASHLAATVTVFFNPSKTVGGMIEAAGFGWLYTLAALTLSLASMYTTDYFLDNDQQITAYIISLGFWLAGSTFVISYLKAKLNTPSILTASGLAFIIIFTVIVRQGSGNEAEFDFDIITETFEIVAIGSAISVAVCIFIWPMTASKKLRSEIDSSLSSTKVLLKLLTKTFLLDSDLPDFTANKSLETAIKTHRTSFTALKAALTDARHEFYNLEMQYHAEGYKTIVESLKRLAQHIGGLKSSCGHQVEVMQQSHSSTPVYSPLPNYGTIATSRRRSSLGKEVFNLKAGPQRKKMETELKKEREREQTTHIEPSASTSSYFDLMTDNTTHVHKHKEGALVQFIRTVRSSMKSLAYTCKQTIVHLQARFMKKTTQDTPSFLLMRQNLKSAIELFESSQQIALARFYKRKFKKAQEINPDEFHTLFLSQRQFPAEDIFLVYFFVFCLLEFAKELMVLVESVQYVFEDIEEMDRTESLFAWTRYLFKRQKVVHQTKEADDFVPNNHNTLNTLHTPAPTTKLRKFLLKMWGFFSKFKTHHFKFALKSMLTAEAISVLAFIPETRPYFTSFKLEWTLITVMAVMTPTVGGTNLGAVLRVIATILGCVLAAVIYTIFNSNTYMLILMTWLVSIPSFWMILNHKHGRFGLFTLLAYNLIVLYKYNNRDNDSIDVFVLTWMRCVAVSLGVVIGLFVTAYIWPYEARTQVRKGLSDLLLRLSWLYKQLVSAYSEEETTYTAQAHELQKIELSIQVDLFHLQGLLVHAPNEPRLKGPFPAQTYEAMLTCCQNILDRFLTLRIVILKDVWVSHVRRHFLMPAAKEFMDMAGNVFLYFYLLASALQLKTPLPPYLPPAEKTRQALMQKLQKVSLQSMQAVELPEEKRDECYMVYYAYVVVMENIIRDLETLGVHMKDLFGVIVPEGQWTRFFGQSIDLEQNRRL